MPYETRVSGLGARLARGQIRCIGLTRAFYDHSVLPVLSEGRPTMVGPTEEVLTKTVAKHAAIKSAGAAQGDVA